MAMMTKHGFGWAIFFLVVQLLLLGIFSWQLPPQIPLWYSLPYGRAQLANRMWFLLIPALSLLGLLVHGLLSRLGKDFLDTYGQLISWLAALIAFLGVVAMIHIVVLTL